MMVQEHQVVKCFSCENFQYPDRNNKYVELLQFNTQIVKKTNKWACKVCGIKQSIKKVYGRGSGKECRLHTQKLNAMRGASSGSKPDHELNTGHGFTQSTPRSPTHATVPRSTCDGSPQRITKTSKWAEFIDEKKNDINEDCVGDTIDNEQEELPNKPLFIGTSCYEKKRKHQKQQSCYNSPPETPNYCAGELNNNFHHSKTESNQRANIKRFKTTENVNVGNDKNECNIKDEIEDSVDIHMSRSLNNRELARKNSAVKSGGKWGKYLTNDNNDNLPVPDGNGFESEETMESTKRDVISQSLSLTEVKFAHDVDDVDCKYSSSSYSNPSGNSNCESKSFHLISESSENEALNKKTFFLPGNIFEQECDSDIDLELNF